MTRYARAKGSKASNERIPNDATPWHIMKQQLEENLSKTEEPVKKVKSAKKLLEEKEDSHYYGSIGNVNNDWADFEEVQSKRQQNPTNDKVIIKDSKKQNKSKEKDQSIEEPKGSVRCNVNENENTASKPSAKRKHDQAGTCITETKVKKHKKDKSQSNEVPDGQNEIGNGITTLQKHKKKEKKQISNGINNDNEVDSKTTKSQKKLKGNKHSTQKSNKTLIKNNDFSQKENSLDASDSTNKVKGDLSKLSKRQKRNRKNRKQIEHVNDSGNPHSFDATMKHNTLHEGNENIETQKKENDQNEDKNKFSMKSQNRTFFNKADNLYNNDSKFGNVKQNHNRKPPKIRDDKEHKRRKPDAGPIKIVINGVSVEIVKFDGFPVRKEDAERLKDLKQQMIMRGIPKEEVTAAMKLERRKAEKALTRIKKCVCFHCRKSGHNLSDCPELGSEQAGTGICFKCGSTEHTHFECKVTKAPEYRYASCFICREQGHIAKQCPDNPKGVYPQGGACKICGDVTHLKKDCPDLAKEKEEATITVDTIANSTLESLDTDTKKIIESDNKKSKNKVVSF